MANPFDDDDLERQHDADLERGQWIAGMAAPDGPFGPRVLLEPPRVLNPHVIVVSPAHATATATDADRIAHLERQVELLEAEMIRLSRGFDR